MSSLSSISGTKISQHTHTSSPTGTKLSQHAQKGPFQPVLPEQGELCTAPSAKPGTKLSLLSRSRGSPGTKLSQHTHTSSPTGTKLSQHAQKGPFQPVLPEQGELCTARTTTTPSRENFVPHQAPNPVQNSPSTPVLQRFREKVRPAHLKTAFSPLSRLQGELFRAQASNKPRRANYFAHWG